MTIVDTDGHVRSALGLYALGALPDDEQYATVDAHLATCSACQAELDEHYEVTFALAMLSHEDAQALAALVDPQPLTAAPPHPKPSWQDRLARWVRPRGLVGPLAYVRVAVLAAFFAVSIGIGVGLMRPAQPAQDTVLAAATVENHTDGLGMAVTVFGRPDHRYTVRAEFSGLPTGTPYALVLITGDGRSHTLREWTSTAATQTFTAEVGTPVGDMAYFALARADGSVVLMAACRADPANTTGGNG